MRLPIAHCGSVPFHLSGRGVRNDGVAAGSSSTRELMDGHTREAYCLLDGSDRDVRRAERGGGAEAAQINLARDKLAGVVTQRAWTTQ